MGIEIYEVQSVVTDGLYSCYKQKLLESGWQAGHGDKFDNAEDTPVPVDVLNLVENNTLGDYSPALAKGDRIAAWAWKDWEGESRLIGIPIVPSVRMARVKEDAPQQTYITCNLIANDGETEITSGLGFNIKVYAQITFGCMLDSASPKLQNGDYIFVQNISGKWWFVTVCQGAKYCICTPTE